MYIRILIVDCTNTYTQESSSKIETLLQSESEYETDTDEDDDDDDEEERMKPIFIPKAKRETIKEQELKLEESKLREDKKIIHDENRKRQVSQLNENSYPAHTHTPTLPAHFASICSIRVRLGLC